MGKLKNMKHSKYEKNNSGSFLIEEILIIITDTIYGQ